LQTIPLLGFTYLFDGRVSIAWVGVGGRLPWLAMERPRFSLNGVVENNLIFFEQMVSAPVQLM
jgi:hypothetical protein